MYEDDKYSAEPTEFVSTVDGKIFFFKRKTIDFAKECPLYCFNIIIYHDMQAESCKAIFNNNVFDLLEKDLIPPEGIIGVMHNPYGPAIFLPNGHFNGFKYHYYYKGTLYSGKEDWFQQLTSDEKYIASWNLWDE